MKINKPYNYIGDEKLRGKAEELAKQVYREGIANTDFGTLFDQVETEDINLAKLQDLDDITVGDKEGFVVDNDVDSQEISIEFSDGEIETYSYTELNKLINKGSRPSAQLGSYTPMGSSSSNTEYIRVNKKGDEYEGMIGRNVSVASFHSTYPHVILDFGDGVRKKYDKTEVTDFYGKDYVNPPDDAILEDGGALDKEFKFEKNFVIYVPSTTNVGSKINPTEMDVRVDAVEKFVADKFGGFTKTETDGGYKATDGDIIEEDIVKVSVFAHDMEWDKNEQEVVDQVKEWAKKWGQEAIGFEYEGQLYYIDDEGKFMDGGEVEESLPYTATFKEGGEIKNLSKESAKAKKNAKYYNESFVVYSENGEAKTIAKETWDSLSSKAKEGRELIETHLSSYDKSRKYAEGGEVMFDHDHYGYSARVPYKGSSYLVEMGRDWNAPFRDVIVSDGMIVIYGGTAEAIYMKMLKDKPSSPPKYDKGGKLDDKHSKYKYLSNKNVEMFRDFGYSEEKIKEVNDRQGRGSQFANTPVNPMFNTYAEGGEIKVIGNKIIISDENDNEYVYRHFLKEDKHYLIPYIDTKSISKEYWEHHFIPKDTWVDIENIDFNDYNITKEQFDSIKNKGLQKQKEILSKYHSSFAKGGSTYAEGGKILTQNDIRYGMIIPSKKYPNRADKVIGFTDKAVKIQSVSPSENNMGSKFGYGMKPYTYRWDGTGYKRQNQYLHSDGIYRIESYAEGGQLPTVSPSRLKEYGEDFITSGKVVDRGWAKFKVEDGIFMMKEGDNDWEKLRRVNYADGGSIKKNLLNDLKAWKKFKIEDLDKAAERIGITSNNYSYKEALKRLNKLVEDATLIIKKGILKNGKYEYYKRFFVKTYNGNILADAYLRLDKNIIRDLPNYAKEWEKEKKEYPNSYDSNRFISKQMGKFTEKKLGFSLRNGDGYTYGNASVGKVYENGGEIDRKIRNDYSDAYKNLEVDVMIDGDRINVYANRDDEKNDGKGAEFLEEINDDYFGGKLKIENWSDERMLLTSSPTYAEGGEIKDYNIEFVVKDEDGEVVEEDTIFFRGSSEKEAKKDAKEYLEDVKKEQYYDEFEPVIEIGKVIDFEHGGKVEMIEIDEDGSNVPPQLMDIFSEFNEDEDAYKEMDRLLIKANEIGYDFNIGLDGTPTEFCEIPKKSWGGGIAIGTAVGGYVGYKIGRARTQKKGFETEKKVGRKIKKAFSKGKDKSGEAAEKTKQWFQS